MIWAAFDLDPFGALVFTEPERVWAAEALPEVRPALCAAEAAAERGQWVAGFVTYEAAPAFDPALSVWTKADRGARGPLAWFAAFRAPSAIGEGEAPVERAARLGALAPELERAAYLSAVERIRAALGRGDAYQVNFTFRLHGRFEGDPWALYRRLHAAQGGRRSAYLRLGDRAIVSVSPELFFERRGDRLTLRPMKGTARRGRFDEEDAALAEGLGASEKDRAENVMITDLMRNDAGRIARVGGVSVRSLCAVESYRTVHQLTSTVEAALRPGTTLEAIFAALFPCGSVTGAPKASAMKRIAAEEVSPRGVYCGAAGLLAPGGDAVFNVAIRTLELDLARGEACYGTGGGITWGSSGEAEWEEARAKAQVLVEPAPDFELVETMRWEGGRCALLERHLARLARSARLLGFRRDDTEIRRALERAVAARPPGDAFKLRLLLGAMGALRLEAGPLPSVARGALPVALSEVPVSRDDRSLFHKTTRRAVYESRQRLRPELFDVLLQNEGGELTEFGIGNRVVEIAGARWTPPREVGLLPGVFREELLAGGGVRERVLRYGDLGHASRIWLVNALRGWVPVRWVG